MHSRPCPRTLAYTDVAYGHIFFQYCLLWLKLNDVDFTREFVNYWLVVIKQTLFVSDQQFLLLKQISYNLTLWRRFVTLCGSAVVKPPWFILYTIFKCRFALKQVNTTGWLWPTCRLQSRLREFAVRQWAANIVSMIWHENKKSAIIMIGIFNQNEPP